MPTARPPRSRQSPRREPNCATLDDTRDGKAHMPEGPLLFTAAASESPREEKAIKTLSLMCHCVM